MHIPFHFSIWHFWILHEILKLKKKHQISPYIIFQFCNARSPDLHIVGGQTLYVFGSSTYGECHCFGPIRFHSLCGSNESKTLLFFDSHLNSLCCCSFTYFCKRMKIFLGAQKYHHFEFLSFLNVLLFPIH